MKVRNKSPNSLPALIGFSLLLIGVAQVTAIWALTRAIFPKIATEPSSIVEVIPAKFSPQLYWLELVDNRIHLVPTTTYTTATSPEIALKDAFAQLLTNSPNSELTTTIPKHTQLLDLQITENGIHINLSREFSRGGGSSSMIYRVAQVIYTATSMDSQAQVFLLIEGQPLNETNPLGGEGLILNYPLTRQIFDNNFLNE
ncbi:MAG: GerMN domain-containing protein [Pleurocapsa sp.]